MAKTVENLTLSCVNDNCPIGLVNIPRLTFSGTLVNHSCGTKAVLIKNKEEDRWELETYQNQTVKGEIDAPEAFKKRGRPAKSANGVAPVPAEAVDVDEKEDDIKLMEQVEEECPYPREANGEFGLAGKGWCSDEFDRRKKELKGKKGKKSTALVKADDIVLNDAFIQKANEAAAEIKDAAQGVVDVIDSGKRKYWAVGEKVINFENNRYYLAFGMKSLREWIKSEFETAGILGATSVYDARDLVRNAKHRLGISTSDFAKIPIQTARLLKSAPQEKVTPEVLEAAKTLTTREFAEQFALKIENTDYIADGSTGEPVVEETIVPVNVSGFKKISPAVADAFNYALDIARWKGNDLRDDSSMPTVDDRALYVIATAIKDTYEVEYQEHIEQEKNKTQAIIDAAEIPEPAPEF